MFGQDLKKLHKKFEDAVAVADADAAAVDVVVVALALALAKTTATATLGACRATVRMRNVLEGA